MAFQTSQTNNTLRAESASFSTSPSFSLYNKVKLADKDFTVIKTGATLELLSTASAGDELTWDEAVNEITQYQKTFGTLGNSYVSNVSMPSSIDFSSLMKGTFLNDNIPKLSTDWWLGDASKDNRSTFIDENNNTEKEISYDRSESDGDSCIVNSKIEKGMKPTTNKDDDIVFNKITGRTGIIIKTDSLFENGVYYNRGCTIQNAYRATTSAATMSVDVDEKGTVTVTTPEANTIQKMFLGIALTQGLKLEVGSSKRINVNSGSCWPATGAPAFESGVTGAIRGPVSASFTVTSSGTSITSPVTCTGLAQEAGKSSLRPKISINASDIAYINSNKREFKPTNSISQEALQSDPIGSNNYLTMRSQDLKAQLDDTSKEVSGTTLTTAIYNNSYIKIPVKISGTSEGSKYVSASATINGIERYAVLKEVSGSTDVVELDISNFADKISDISTLNLTLYQENSGDYDTAYIGEGTNITIKIIKPQEIAFDENQETTLEYGTDLELTSRLTSSINDQADSDIVYSIKEGNATITAQSYDKTNGKATATIHPTNGIGTVVVAINKAEDGDALAASEKTYSINLSKKKAVIYPKKPSKAYTLGDQMFTVESESTDLENDDTIPNTIVPELINTDNSNTPPDNNGTINAIGTWKLLYPVNILDNIDTTDFGKKYDIELKDYDEDTSYIFESVITDIPSGWIIVTPNANAKGWNNGTVTINLSDEAKSLGYTEIEVISSSNEILNQGSSIVYDSEISSITPLIRLKKGDTKTSSETIREIKIDVTKPTANIALEKESDWGTKKTVTITASDALSGIDTITVSLNGTPYTVTQDSTDTSVYTFEADQEGIYDIVVTDQAGNTTSLTQKVENIDTSTVTVDAVAESLTEDQPKQKITLTFDAGTSGIDTFKVYYKGCGDSDYKFYKNLETTITSPYDFDAYMNGSFKFELINKAGSSAEDTVEITHVNPPKPVTKIDATWEKDTTKTYTSNTWTNQNVMLTLSNINPAITGDITWQISEDGTTWTDLDSNTKLVSTDSVLEKTYQFKSKTGEATEEEAQSFTVKIDKTKPAVPVIDHHEDYISSAWFENGFEVTASVVAKEHNTTIGQDIYVCDGKKADCISTSSLWKKTNKGTYAVSGNAKHELYFKTIDEAGNESELTSPAYINLNNTAPVITISLNESKVKDILHTITLGFFFKDTVNITFDVEYGLDTGGTVKYILDKNANRSTPLPDASDSRWVEGTSDSLTPDDKAMIYVMATSAAGVTTIESSEYNVYADKTPPVITIPDTSAWTKETTLDVEIKDALSGVDVNTVEYKIDQGAYVSASIAKDTMTISGLSDGTYDIFVNASDYSGNRLTKDAKTTVHIDTVAPVVGTITPAKTGWISEQKITFTASDALSGLDGLPVIKGTDHKALTVTENEDGSYSCKITKNDTYTISVKDLAGNETTATYAEAHIDTEPPVITGVKDQKEYKQYYLPRYVTVEDKGSGVSTATYTKQNETAVPIVGETRIFGTGDYVIDAEDVAGNTTTLAFRIVNLPDIDTEIDGSDESREIIDQIIKELEEVKDKIDSTEKDNYDKWITDAEDKWEKLRKKVVEHEETNSKIEGQGNITFDPKTELIVEEIPKEKVPVLPRNAIKTYDVYLKKGNSVVQANGTVKVYLPYDEKEAPIVYEIKEDGTITEVAAVQEDGYVTFITDTLSQYAISNTAQEETKPTPNPDPTPDPDPNPDDGKVCVAGPDGKLGTADDVCVDPGEDNKKPDKNPDGSIDVPGGGTIVFPDGGEIPIGPNDTGTLKPDGSVEIKPSGDKYGPDGKPIKPDTCPNEGTEINIDTNKDGRPDLNIDTDGDCKADLNVDVNDDGIPDVNIDTTLDGKPDYNLDIDEDGKPDINIGPVNDPWKPTVCKRVGTLEYCSDPYKAPYLNVDTDGDGRPDLNLDLDGDLEADLNIDVDGDFIPDVNIDSTGDGKPDINVDIDNDGKADENLLKLTKWIPNKDVDGRIKYDTMTGLVPDPELNKNPNDGGYLSGTGNDVINTSAQGGAYTNADTGDIVKTSFWWILVLINGGITLYFIYKRRKQKAE